MFFRRLLPVLTLCCVLSAVASAAHNSSYAPDEVLVRFRPSAHGLRASASAPAPLSAAAVSALRSVGGSDARSLNPASPTPRLSAAAADGFEPLSRTYRVQLPAGSDVAAAIDKLKADPIVESAEPNRRLFFSVTPDDSFYSTQWTYKNTGQAGSKDSYDPASGVAGADIDAAIAWDVTSGDGSVIVAVIDSGLDATHPDLASHVWTNSGEIPNNGIDDDMNGYIDDAHGWDFGNAAFPGDNNPADDCGSNALGQGHGTHVSGIISAVSDNANGVVGTIWNAKLMPLKVATTGCGLYTADVVRAIEYATNEGARVINMSLGGSQTDAFETAVDAAKAAGVTIVAAAGNQGDSSPIYPAAYDSVIGVAATDRRDAKASFSAYGTWVSLAAPGVALRSTYPVADGSYAYLSGTSMASPVVAGVAALILTKYPSLTPAQVEARLLNSCENIGVADIGAGRVNAARALMNIATVSPAVATAGISASFTVTGTAFQTGMSARLARAGSSSIDATNVVVQNDHQLTCDFTPASSSTGTWSVEIVLGRTVYMLPSALVVEGIELVDASPVVWPDTGVAGPITLTGKNFGSNMTAFLRRSGHSDIASSALVVGSTTSAVVSFNVTGAAGGRWDVVVSSAGAVSALSRKFVVTSPSYLVVSPPVGTASQFSVPVAQGVVTLDWPAGALSSPVNIDIDAAPVLPALDSRRDPYVATGIGVVLEIVGGPSLFDQAFNLTLPYRNIDLADATRDRSLTLAYFNETTSRWQPVGDVVVNESVRTVTGSAVHFSAFQIVQHIPAQDMDRVVAYPSPFRPDRGHDRIVFDFLPANATVKIFTLAGMLIRELTDDDGDGRIDWLGVTTDGGEKIASGVYHYVVTSGGKTKSGRLAVLR